MASVAEIEKLAFELSDKQRAVLAAQLLRSLPAVLHDDDYEGKPAMILQ